MLAVDVVATAGARRSAARFFEGECFGARVQAADSDPADRLGELGGYRVEHMSQSRRLAMEGYESMPRGHKMLALLELDVTELLQAIDRWREQGQRVSLFASVVAAIGRALAEFPALNAIHEGRSIYVFDDVDINIPVELPTSDGVMPRQVVVRRAQTKAPAEIYVEIEHARERFAAHGDAGGEDRWTRRLARIAFLLPHFVRMFILRRMVRSAKLAKRFAGTTFVTSVGKFATIPGFVVPYVEAPMTVLFALGSVVEKPAVVDGAIIARSFLSLTLTLDHDVVDGAPAARFATRLQELIEHPARWMNTAPLALGVQRDGEGSQESRGAA